MQTTKPTWRVFADRLTPEQVDLLERCDRNLTHPSGDPEKHRVGMIVMAQQYSMMGAGGLN